MSKINAVRLINVNYNNNAIRISDECFHFNGESTLVSLRNGGGKSVLVQMMMAPFVHKRYRDAKDRPFESYFTTNKPSFILVEWVLDQGAGYVMTGMMVRRNQDTGEGNTDSLEMINFVSEYRQPCVQDIHHLPVVEKGKKEMVLKNFSACRQMFEMYKKDRSMQFFYYDMNNSAQSRQYFDKLMEYQINYKEWETIIKKVNLKESGLSELFSDCRDEKGLVEKWFLDAVENKLNKEKNRMKEFQVILEKYAGQYKDNQSKIRRRDTIRAFEEEAVRIREKAEYYQETDEKQKMQENQVACFIKELDILRDCTEEEHQKVMEQVETIQEAIARVEYEKLSSEVYELKDQMNFHTGNRDMIEMEKDNLEREAEKTEEFLHLLACAKQQESVDSEKEELELLRQKLLVIQKKEEELEPERNALGKRLRNYYEYKLQENDFQTEKNRENQQKVTDQINELQRKSTELEQQIRKAAGEEGGLKSKVQIYDRQEEAYHTRYEEALVRNILGEYEPGTLEILRTTYDQQMEETVRERVRKKKQQETGQENLRRLERTLEDIRAELIRSRMEREKQEEIGKTYEEELNVRRVILKYLNLDEKEIFHTETILRASERKRLEIDKIRRNLEKEEDVLQKEYRRLTQGKTMEIPEELEAEISGLGIHPVYGMEWLQKNGYSEEQNRELVRQHPFLPYALILSKKDLEKLRRSEGGSYTSFPIPIVIREELAVKKPENTGNIVSLAGINFYVLFNENLLNEEKLQILVQEKEQEIHRKKEAISVRKKEYDEYFKRQEIIENQKVTGERYEKNHLLIKELMVKTEELEKCLRTTTEEYAQLKDQLEILDKEIQALKEKTEFQKRRLEDFEELTADYEAYLENRRKLEQCRKHTVRFQEQKELTQNQLEKQREYLRTLETAHDVLELKKQDVQGHYLIYEKYERPDSDEEILSAEEAQTLELRYTAVTEKMSVEIQELEKQEKRAAERYEEAGDELIYLQKKYRLLSGAWKKIHYSRKEESHQEILLESFKMKIENRRMLWGEEDKKIAVIAQQIRERMQRIVSECGKEQPLPAYEIQNQDFDARKNQLRFQEKEAVKSADRLKGKLHSYEENLTALSEYSEFPLIEQVEWEEAFAEMNERELRNFKGILIRDYNQMVRDRQSAKERLIQVLNQIVRVDAFQEEFYKKPLESMLELTDDAAQVLRQLDTTIQSYDSLMEKLEVDISVVEKEKDRIVELMEEYVREVHQNLGMIDHNSTITIREKPVKMLRIQLPEWEENENLYHIRLQDMIDEVTLKGVELFEKNENAQEYFGTRITTRNLYDTVIGIGNVQIRLYKIEEQREYPITWAEVAKNSGGEGFLSAFVILSSLLYYMRKDDTDIFADRNEGKVLVMDNPFAQTNASHLLKPLMDMAKKTNTQLICLSGLGGESIYNRFNNIYILNLIAASLRNGMQYLKADHVRGNEPETMVVSQVEVMEQQELIF
ncbi:MAG: hypothetical protein ACI4TF_12425 [Oliverpabstia sp.]